MNKNSDTSAQVSMVKSKQIEPSDDLSIIEESKKNAATLKSINTIVREQVDLENPNFILGYN